MKAEANSQSRSITVFSAIALILIGGLMGWSIAYAVTNKNHALADTVVGAIIGGIVWAVFISQKFSKTYHGSLMPIEIENEKLIYHKPEERLKVWLN